jgi:hypothetical protein
MYNGEGNERKEPRNRRDGDKGMGGDREMKIHPPISSYLPIPSPF